jgi:predicted DNA-binding ribbon-helix-helix protein
MMPNPSFAPREIRESGLITRNIWIGDHRTSVRLEHEHWELLVHIAHREKVNLNVLCSEIAATKPEGRSLTSALRVFVSTYFRNQVKELT